MRALTLPVFLKPSYRLYSSRAKTTTSRPMSVGSGRTKSAYVMRGRHSIQQVHIRTPPDEGRHGVHRAGCAWSAAGRPLLHARADDHPPQRRR